MKVRFTVNGKSQQVETEGDRPLLEVLPPRDPPREELEEERSAMMGSVFGIAANCRIAAVRKAGTEATGHGHRVQREHARQHSAPLERDRSRKRSRR